MINIYSADSKYLLKGKRKIKYWLSHLCEASGFTIEEINIILCSDEYLLDINKKYLDHSYLTDVITFDNSINMVISGEIYISVERIKENALEYEISVYNEFLRVISHGLLHLMGFKDSTPGEKEIMRKKEDEAVLAFYSFKS